jgi:alpha-galactosidase
MFRHLGLYVTESSGHNSEYNWWYRKRQDLINKYVDPATGDQPGVPFIVLKEMEPGQDWRETTFQEFLAEPVDLARGDEFAPGVINAVLGDRQPFTFYGNVLNSGAISNLPADANVEIPLTVDMGSFSKQLIGALPAHVAALNYVNATADNLAVEGYLAKDPDKVFQAIALDPLTAATLSLEEIHDMVWEMFAAAKAWLPEYHLGQAGRGPNAHRN